ncbi:unnamed protein product [Rhizoctonia solani]|uniref:Laminin domain protein n=1 Tax=Rhizoctonia solani TaxID=456999 RepID=A0A8H3BZL2_9AGAM|nr:unnamed protein product [Rhizoctonia solani]
MADHIGWYPAGQVCHPPELPVYLKQICDLKPVVGVPKDDEVIGIHSVVLAANKVSGVQGMHDSRLFMKLSDHLFSIQMAKYRSKYSLITFPSDATYTPPTLPAHVSVQLEPVVGAPSDEDITKVQDAVRVYQHFSTVVPSMFDPRVNMELSQHLFDIQMARHMRNAGESLPNPALEVATESPVRAVEQTLNTAEEPIFAANNAGTGGNAVVVNQIPQLPPGNDIIREVTEQSNQIAERFNQVLERLTQLVERTNQPKDQNNRLAERFDHLIERFNTLEQSNQSVLGGNQLAELLIERSTQFAEQLGRSSERSNQLAEQANKQGEILGEVMKNINRVLVGIQHAIVRNYKGNTTNAADCLTNEKGETLATSKTAYYVSQASFLSRAPLLTHNTLFAIHHSGNI